MDLIRLSDRIKASKQQAAYHRSFLQAATDGQFAGVIELADTIKLPPAKKGGKHREVADYAIMPTPEFETWHEQIIASTNSKNKRRHAPRFADLAAGRVSITEAAQHTADQLAKRRARNAQIAARARERRTTTDTDE